MFKLIRPAKKFTRSLIVTVAASGSALALSAAPALAADSSQAGVPFYRCHLSASEPFVAAEGNEIVGIGSSLCVGTGWQDQKLVVTIEEQVFSTLYVVRAQASTGYSRSPFLFRPVVWNCTGAGTHLYTVETSWYGRNGAAYGYTFPPRSVTITCAG
jgi:hypothetical protein